MGSLRNIEKVAAMVEAARREKKWFYDRKYKTWWNPDEFLKEFSIGGDLEYFQFFRSLEMRDPFEGVKEAGDKLNGMQKKVEAFSQRVLRYYQGKTVDPPR